MAFPAFPNGFKFLLKSVSLYPLSELLCKYKPYFLYNQIFYEKVLLKNFKDSFLCSSELLCKCKPYFLYNQIFEEKVLLKIV